MKFFPKFLEIPNSLGNNDFLTTWVMRAQRMNILFLIGRCGSKKKSFSVNFVS